MKYKKHAFEDIWGTPKYPQLEGWESQKDEKNTEIDPNYSMFSPQDI